MNLTALQTVFSGTYTPWLPDAALARWALHGAWALVLGAITLRLGWHFWPKWRGWVASAVVVWAFWPGTASPAHWLGLAFQSPSLMSVVLCALWAWQPRPRSPFADHTSRANAWPWAVFIGATVVLGWVLLLDMLAWWPVSVYAWGFGPAALTLVCGLALLLWLADGAAGERAVWCLGLVLVVFVVTRLPSGNLWDALLDPWLWLVLQVRGLMAWVRGRSSARRWS